MLGRALARTARHCLVLLPLLAGLTFPQAALADDPVKGEATFSASGGYARLMMKLAEDVESDVTTAGSIIVIRFKRPVDIPVDKLSDAVPDYVGSARRDPDGIGDPAFTGTACDRQHHDGGRTDLRRLPAR